MAKGGARCGAGRPGYRAKAEQLVRVDIRVWHRRGLLWVGGTNWFPFYRGNQHTTTVRFTVSADSIRLAYSLDNNEYSQTISTTTTPCALGGTRPWFECPRCFGRCGLLYMRYGRFACRSCQQVSYTSQSGSESDRVHARYHRLHALVEAGKPKWQRWATFNSVEEQFQRADRQANHHLLQVIQRLRPGASPFD